MRIKMVIESKIILLPNTTPPSSVAAHLEQLSSIDAFCAHLVV